MNASIHPFSLPLRTPVSTSEGTINRRDGFVLHIETTDHVGYGEATPFPGWTESFRRCELTLEQCRDALRDGDVATALSIAADTPATRHAVDLAVQDLRAKRADLSLARSLGAAPDADSVPVNATIGSTDLETTVESAAELVEAGFDCLKLKVGVTAPETDAERVAAVSDTVPNGTDIRIDANGAWTNSELETFLDTLGAVSLEYLEQPLASDDFAGHASLRDRGLDIALDEAVTTHPIQAILDAGAADAVVLKPMAVGGIERTHTVGTTASNAGVDPVLSTTIDAAIARVAATHLAAALPTTRAAGLATGSNFGTDLAPDAPHIVDGVARLPEGNGNGVAPATVDDE